MKFKADSRLGRKLLARGKDLTVVAAPLLDKADTELMAATPFRLGSEVWVEAGEHKNEAGVVRWVGVQRGEVVLGLGALPDEPRREELIFVNASDCSEWA